MRIKLGRRNSPSTSNLLVATDSQINLTANRAKQAQSKIASIFKLTHFQIFKFKWHIKKGGRGHSQFTIKTFTIHHSQFTIKNGWRGNHRINSSPRQLIRSSTLIFKLTHFQIFKLFHQLIK
jgi:hypothetical protein